jgi:hypothetical protein
MRGGPILAGLFLAWPAAAQKVEFNRDIRPILSDKCFTCHGPDQANRKSPLRLDIESAAKAELGRGRFALVPGNPGRSEVYRRITSENKVLRMPPEYLGRERLKDGEIELIRRWIERGAEYQQHWSLIPPKRPAPPEVRDGSRVRNEIDRFVLSRLEREGLQPSPEADRATLIRRVALDLTGLPPDPRDVQEGEYEAIVDRLLASPRYAEHMAVRWLEAARYADTNGYQTDGPREMWRWRDWVIDAFQRNMPFDRFTVEQIAGDLLPHAALSQKIATAFHRNHRTSAEGGIVDEEFRVEYVADRVDTTGTVWMGLTVGCARCHDHKYDPITQKEYYQLFAFFNNVPEKGFVYNFGNEEPYIKAPLPEQQRRLDELDRQAAEAEAKVRSLEGKTARAQRKWERRLKPLAWELTAGQVYHNPLEGGTRFDGQHFIEAGKDIAKFDYRDPFTFAARIKPESGDGAILSRAEDYFEGQGHALYLVEGKLRLHVIFRWTDLGMRIETAQPVKIGEWQHVLVTYDGGMKASGVRMYVDGEPQELKVLFDQLLWPLDHKEPFRIGAGGGKRFRGMISDVRAYNAALSAEEAAVVALADPVERIAVLPPESRSRAQAEKLRLCFLDVAAPREVRRARDRLETVRKMKQEYLASIPTVMVMAERPERRQTFLLKRGAYDAPGEKVEPGVPRVLPPLRPEWPRNRLGLARWLVDRSNPLTARVIVNRFWQMFFGAGIVKTVEDFGSQGEWPTHPELLDWLAVEFMESGWDVKSLLRTIVSSATYRQSSNVTPELLQRDPENRLLARGPRFRLPAEVIRDQALAVAGLLVERTGGPSVRPYQPPGLWQELHGGKGYEQDHGAGLYRRSLYTYWKRTVAPPNMMNFDAPNRETCVVRQVRTNTPLQALSLMNDVTFVEASRKLAERMMVEGGRSERDRIGWVFRTVLARPPRGDESEVLEQALAKFRSHYAANEADAVALLGQGESPRNLKLDARELAAYTGVASLVLNLDETITKE